jgi:hypothetical protein
MIKSFRALPPEIRQGEPTILSWEVVNASRVTITNATPSSDGTVDPEKGSLLVSPRVTTTYTLTACNPAGDCVSASVTVNVKPLLPVIVRFTANPANILKGGSSVLSWEVEHASLVTLTNSIDDWNVQIKDDLTVAPRSTTTYTLTAFNAAGESVSAAVTVTVEERPAPASISSFTATPDTINAGQCATLTWRTRLASRVTLSNSVTGVVQEVVENGSMQVCPTVTTTYVLKTYDEAGGDGEAEAVTVRVQ